MIPTGRWWILDEPELHLGEDVLVPDLAGGRRERVPALPRVAAFELAPDWVCEVVSPSTARIDRVSKMSIYGREEEGHLWLVDPLTRTLEVYRRSGEHWVVVCTEGGERRVRAEPFEEVEMDMSFWWIPEESAVESVAAEEGEGG